MEKKQFEDSVKQLETDNTHKQQQLLEAHDHLEDVQKQLDSAKVVLAVCLVTGLTCDLFIGQCS